MQEKVRRNPELNPEQRFGRLLDAVASYRGAETLPDIAEKQKEMIVFAIDFSGVPQGEQQTAYLKHKERLDAVPGLKDDVNTALAVAHTISRIKRKPNQ